MYITYNIILVLAMRTFVAAVVLFLGFVMFCMADTDEEVTEAPYNYDVETGEGEVNIIIFCMPDTDQEVTEAPYYYDVETGEGEVNIIIFCMADTDQKVTEALYNYDVEIYEGEVNIIIFRQYRNSMCFCNFKVEKKLLPMINIQITSEAQDLYTAFNLILV